MQTIIPAYSPTLYNSRPLSEAAIASRSHATVISSADYSTSSQVLSNPATAPSVTVTLSASKATPNPREPNQEIPENPELKEDLAKQKLQKIESDQASAEQLDIQQLAARDREVRSHEQAHAAAGGQYAGAPVYEFQRGPNGVSYAVGGHVSIDASSIPGDPQASIDKAQIIKRAALAPGEPSGQDRQVAAQAIKMEIDARAELSTRQAEERLATINSSNGASSVKEVFISSAKESSRESKEMNDASNARVGDGDSLQNLTTMGEVIERMSSTLNQKIMSSDILQPALSGQLINYTA